MAAPGFPEAIQLTGYCVAVPGILARICCVRRIAVAAVRIFAPTGLGFAWPRRGSKATDTNPQFGVRSRCLWLGRADARQVSDLPATNHLVRVFDLSSLAVIDRPALPAFRQVRDLPRIGVTEPPPESNMKTGATGREQGHLTEAVSIRFQQMLFQIPTGVRLFRFYDLLRCPGGYDLTTSVSAFRSQINYIIRRLDNVEIVLDHQQRTAGIYQRAEGCQQLIDIIE